MDAVEEMGGGDVAHVEGRILAELDHVERREVRQHRLAEGEMVARNVAHGDRLDARLDATVAEREALGRVVEEDVAAPRRFQHEREGGIAADVDAGDVVHLEGDGERHGYLLGRPLIPRRAGKRQLSPRRAPFAEGGDEMDRQAPGCGDDDVEALVEPGRLGVRGDEMAGGARYARPRFRGHRVEPGRLVRALLDLDEDEAAAAAHDEIDLADGRPVAAGDEAIELQAKVPERDRLGAASGLLGAPAARIGGAPPHRLSFSARARW